MTQALEKLITQYISAAKAAGAVHDISIPVGPSVPPELVFRLAMSTPGVKSTEHDSETNTMTLKLVKPAYLPPGARYAHEIKAPDQDDYMVSPEGSVHSEEGFTPVQYKQQQQQQYPHNYKTSLCMYYVQKGNCGHGKKCNFAHGERELRV